MKLLKVVSYNMLKGHSFLSRKYSLEPMKEALMQLSPDILFLQEFRGLHPKKWIAEYSPAEIFSLDHFPYHAYGMNAEYQKGHHGNAIFSKYPIIESENIDISQIPLAKRGVLHAKVQISSDANPLHLLCAHLDLFQKARNKQVAHIFSMIQKAIPSQEPMILAGDFNDWNKKVDRQVMEQLNLKSQPKLLPKTFPAVFPVFPLDRIYVRHLQVLSLSPEKGAPWIWLSDHLPLVMSCHISI